VKYHSEQDVLYSGVARCPHAVLRFCGKLS
jgi:hypothetical protein